MNQALSTLVSAASLRTHHLRLLVSPCAQGRRTKVFPYWSAAPAVVQLRSAHDCCKLRNMIHVHPADVAESVSVNRISTLFLSNPNNLRNKHILRTLFSTTKLQYKEFSSSSSTNTESGITEKELKREIDDLTDKFMETRELLEDAMEAKGTVYFNDDLKDAKESVQETLSQYEDLMAKLSEEQERNVRRTIGLKMEELRAQEAMIDESMKD